MCMFIFIYAYYINLLYYYNTVNIYNNIKCIYN